MKESFNRAFFSDDIIQTCSPPMSFDSFMAPPPLSSQLLRWRPPSSQTAACVLPWVMAEPLNSSTGSISNTSNETATVGFNEDVDEMSSCLSWDFSFSDKTFLAFILVFLACVILSSAANGFLLFLTEIQAPLVAATVPSAEKHIGLWHRANFFYRFGCTDFYRAEANSDLWMLVHCTVLYHTLFCPHGPDDPDSNGRGTLHIYLPQHPLPQDDRHLQCSR